MRDCKSGMVKNYNVYNDCIHYVCMASWYMYLSFINRGVIKKYVNIFTNVHSTYMYVHMCAYTYVFACIINDMYIHTCIYIIALHVITLHIALSRIRMFILVVVLNTLYSDKSLANHQIHQYFPYR